MHFPTHMFTFIRLCADSVYVISVDNDSETCFCDRCGANDDPDYNCQHFSEEDVSCTKNPGTCHMRNVTCAGAGYHLH